LRWHVEHADAVSTANNRPIAAAKLARIRISALLRLSVSRLSVPSLLVSVLSWEAL